MAGNTYHSDQQRQRLAQEELDRAVQHGRETRDEFKARYGPLSGWEGVDDNFAREIKRHNFYGGVVQTMDQVLLGLASAWDRAQEVGFEVERPRDQAVEDINDLSRRRSRP